MAKESGLRHQVLEKLAPLHAVAIESPIEPGTPDVNCTAGWIELKHLDSWPARADTVVKPPHFDPDQRLWLKKRCVSGGAAWLLLRVGSEWCLVWGKSAAMHLGVFWTRSDLVRDDLPTSYDCGFEIAWDRVYFRRPPSSNELIRALVIRRWLP